MEVGVQAEAAAVTPVIRFGDSISVEVRRAELTVERGLCVGCRDANGEEEQDKKSAVKTGTTDRKSIHSKKASTQTALTAWGV
jgi:hypothetical protein